MVKQDDAAVKKVKDARDAVEDAACALRRAEYEYLEARGWKHTCQVPGAYWGWTKQLPDGRTLFVPESMAMQIQQAITPDDFEEDSKDW